MKCLSLGLEKLGFTSAPSEKCVSSLEYVFHVSSHNCLRKCTIFISETRNAGLELETSRLFVFSTISVATFQTAKDTNLIIDIRYLQLTPFRMFVRCVNQSASVRERLPVSYFLCYAPPQSCTVYEHMNVLCTDVGMHFWPVVLTLRSLLLVTLIVTRIASSWYGICSRLVFLTGVRSPLWDELYWVRISSSVPEICLLYSSLLKCAIYASCACCCVNGMWCILLFEDRRRNNNTACLVLCGYTMSKNKLNLTLPPGSIEPAPPITPVSTGPVNIDVPVVPE
jgi:hypothetical protein